MPWNAEVRDVSNKMFFPLSSLWIMEEKHLSRNTAEPGTDRSLHARRLISEKFVSASTMNTKRSLAKACSLPSWGQLASLNIRTQLHPGKTLNISLCWIPIAPGWRSGYKETVWPKDRLDLLLIPLLKVSELSGFDLIQAHGTEIKLEQRDRYYSLRLSRVIGERPIRFAKKQGMGNILITSEQQMGWKQSLLWQGYFLPPEHAVRLASPPSPASGSPYR